MTNKRKRKPKLLIDGDLILYRAAVVCETELDLGVLKEGSDPVKVLSNDLRQVKKLFKATVDGIKKDLKGGEVVVCFSDSKNFRKSIYPPYKANRKDKRLPMGWNDLTEWRKGGEFPFKTFVVPTLEADDCIGIGMTKPGIDPESVIAVSDDKDFMSIPGKFYRIGVKERLPSKHHQTELEADVFFYKQALMGDTTDGFGGCPNVGEKTAEKVINNALNKMKKGDDYHAVLWRAVVNEYIKKGLKEEDALINARMARILRWEDYDHERKMPIRWLPKYGLLNEEHREKPEERFIDKDEQ